MDSNNIQYMQEFIRYIELRAKAQKKGIDVLAEVKEMPDAPHELVADNVKWGYAVVKHIGNRKIIITEDCKMEWTRGYYCDDGSQLIFYPHSLTEAEKIVENYNESFVKRLKFYGFIRQYEGEPHNILDYQVMALNHFAEKYGIQYETIFGCRGGYAETEEDEDYMEDEHGRSNINNLQYVCEKFFTDIGKNQGILCVTDESRLDRGLFSWMDYTTGIVQVDGVKYNHDNIMEYHKYNPYNPKQEQECTPEYGCNSIPGDVPEYISEPEYGYVFDEEQEYRPGDNCPF